MTYLSKEIEHEIEYFQRLHGHFSVKIQDMINQQEDNR